MMLGLLFVAVEIGSALFQASWWEVASVEAGMTDLACMLTPPTGAAAAAGKLTAAPLATPHRTGESTPHLVRPASAANADDCSEAGLLTKPLPVI